MFKAVELDVQFSLKLPDDFRDRLRAVVVADVKLEAPVGLAGDGLQRLAQEPGFIRGDDNRQRDGAGRAHVCGREFLPATTANCRQRMSRILWTGSHATSR